MKRILQLALLIATPLMTFAQLPHVEQFEVGNALLLSGTSFSPFVNFEETGCGEVMITRKPGETIGTFKPMVYTPRDNKGSSLVETTQFDMTDQLELHIRMRGAQGMKVRARYVNPTSTNRTEAEFTLATDYEFETISINASGSSVNFTPTTGFDPSIVQRVQLFFDPSNENFPNDTIYIDWIVMGKLPTDIDNSACRSNIDTFGGGDSYFVENFNGPEPALGGEGADTVTLTQGDGVLTVSEKSGKTLREFKPLVLALPDTFNITNTPKLIVRATPETADMQLRIDLVDENGNSTNAQTGRVTKTFPAGETSEIEFAFRDIAFFTSDGDPVDKTAIQALNIFFVGSDGLPFGSVDFDLISVGEIVDLTNLFEPEEIQKLQLHPNPASNVFTVNATEKGTLRIMNQLGQVVESVQLAGGVQNISIDGLEQGIYIVNQTLESGEVFSTTLVKK